MTDMNLAVRCLQIEEEVAAIEVEIRELQTQIAFRDDDDDSPALAGIAAKQAAVEALRAEQADCAARMGTAPDLHDATLAHAES